MEKISGQEPPVVITSDTENATQIHPSEAPPGDRKKFLRFRAYNTGLWKGPKEENTEAFHRQDDLHRFDSISSALELTDYQKTRGREILDDFDSHHFGESIDKIIFGICVLVANDDVATGCRFHPNPDAADDHLFLEIADSLDLDVKQQWSAVEKVRPKIDL